MVMMTMLTNRDLQGPLEVPRDKLEKERQKAKKKGWLNGVVFAIFMLVFNMFFKWQEGKNPFEILFNPLFLSIFIFSGFIFGAIMGLWLLVKLILKKISTLFIRVLIFNAFYLIS